MKFYDALPGCDKDKIELIAHYCSRKRQIVAEELDIKLPGDKDEDWYQAVSLYQDFGKKSTPATYEPQIRTACEIYRSMFLKGQRNHQLTAPFQNGKTGVALCLAEIYLYEKQKNKQLAKVVFIPLNGQVEIEKQLNDRLKEYRYTSCYKHFSLHANTYRCNGSRNELEKLGKLVEDSENILLIPDESQWGTAVDSKFDKLVLQKVRR